MPPQQLTESQSDLTWALTYDFLNHSLTKLLECGAITALQIQSSVDHYADTESQIVLYLTGHRYRLPWSDPDDLLPTALNDVPVNLAQARIEPVVDLQVHTTSERPSHTGFFYGEVVYSEDEGQLWTVDVDLLMPDTHEPVTKRL